MSALKKKKTDRKWILTEESRKKIDIVNSKSDFDLYEVGNSIQSLSSSVMTWPEPSTHHEISVRILF